MKTIVIVLMSAMMLAACSTIYPPPTDPVCAKPDAAGSIICATAARLSMTPEQIDAAFLDAALVGIATKIIKSDELRRAVTKARTWVAERDILSIDGLTKYLVTESTVDPALALLISRRIGLINLPDLGIKPLTKYDKELVLAGIDHQLAQLAYF